jgi:hypothetical protein
MAMGVIMAVLIIMATISRVATSVKPIQTAEKRFGLLTKWTPLQKENSMRDE